MVNYSKFLSSRGKALQSSPIRAIQTLLRIPGIISLAGGLPNPSQFPIKGLSFTLGNDPITLSSEELSVALQYSATPGLPELVQFLEDFQSFQHKRDFSHSQLVVTNGSQDGLSRAFDMLIDPGDVVIVEDPCYPGSLYNLKPRNCIIEPVSIDEHGIIIEQLENTLKQYEGRVKLLYLVPTTQNPSGVTTSLDRRNAIYALACRYDILILEDDPYYYLTENNVSSLWSLDTENRVIRFDSFSKILSAGLRVGFATGPKKLMDAMIFLGESSLMHVSGVSQGIVLKIVQKWGHDGLMDHIANVSKFYVSRRDMLVRLANEHLGNRVEFVVPNSGMFLWVKLKGVKDSKPIVDSLAKDQKVLFMPGGAFTVKSGPSSYIRLSFSVANDDQMEHAMIQFGKFLQSSL